MKLLRRPFRYAPVAALALALAGGMAPAQAANAVFDAATGTLTLPTLRLGNVRADSVVIRLLDPGSLQLNDPSVGSVIEFLSTGNVLRLPAVSVNGQVFNNVTLTNPQVVIQSYGPIVIDPELGGNYTLRLQLSVAGAAPIELPSIQNVPKPASQAEFCGDARLQELRNTITQQAGNAVGTLTLTGCSFNGTSGQISMNMTISTGFFNLNTPYTADYTYQ